METDPFPDIEYSVITSNVIKSFDCIIVSMGESTQKIKKILNF